MGEYFDPSNRDPEEIGSSGVNLPGRLIASVRLAIADYAIGLDLNRYRQGVDIKVAKQNGIRFIICKATQGTTPPHPDQIPTYEDYRDQAKLRNLPFGGYHYWDARSNPIDQAKHFYDISGGGQLDLLPKLDCEKYGNQGVLSQADAAQSIHDTAQEIEQLFAPDYAPGMVECEIYTNVDSWHVLTGNSPIISTYPLWVASWTTGASPSLPNGAEDWLDWQYTNQYQLPGYPKGLDANRFHGNEGAFEKYVESLHEIPTGGHDHPGIQAQIDALELVNVDQDLKIASLHQHGIDVNEILKVQEIRIKSQEEKMDGIGREASGNE